jgi:hypothetical protein
MEADSSLISLDSRQRQSATAIAIEIPDVESRVLITFIDTLLDIRASKEGKLRKLKATITATLRAKLIWPAIKLIYRECKDRFWDKRSTTTRFGLAGSLIGLTFFGGQGAGIAALGGAIGVPLWVVFGAGAMYANYLREELVDRLNPHNGPKIDL